MKETIIEGKKIKFLSQDKFQVSSSTGGYYDIDISRQTCSCPHYMYRLSKSGGICKHIQLVLNNLSQFIEDTNTDIKDEEVIKYVEENKVVDYEDLIQRYPESVITKLVREFELFVDRGRVRKL